MSGVWGESTVSRQLLGLLELGFDFEGLVVGRPVGWIGVVVTVHSQVLRRRRLAEINRYVCERSPLNGSLKKGGHGTSLRRDGIFSTIRPAGAVAAS